MCCWNQRRSLEWGNGLGIQQQEAARGFSVQRAGEMGGMIQFTQVESETHFIGEQECDDNKREAGSNEKSISENR